MLFLQNSLLTGIIKKDIWLLTLPNMIDLILEIFLILNTICSTAIKLKTLI